MSISSSLDGSVRPRALSRWTSDPFRDFKTSPTIIRLAVMMYIRFPPSLRRVEDLLHGRGIDISYETCLTASRNFAPTSPRREVN